MNVLLESQVAGLMLCVAIGELPIALLVTIVALATYVVRGSGK